MELWPLIGRREASAGCVERGGGGWWWRGFLPVRTAAVQCVKSAAPRSRVSVSFTAGGINISSPREMKLGSSS